MVALLRQVPVPLVQGAEEECFKLLNRSQFVTSSFISCFVSWNLTLSGKRATFLFTFWFRTFVSTLTTFSRIWQHPA